MKTVSTIKDVTSTFLSMPCSVAFLHSRQTHKGNCWQIYICLMSMFGYFMLLHTQLVPRVLFTVFQRFNELKTELKTIKNKNSL